MNEWCNKNWLKTTPDKIEIPHEIVKDPQQIAEHFCHIGKNLQNKPHQTDQNMLQNTFSKS